MQFISSKKLDELIQESTQNDDLMYTLVEPQLIYLFNQFAGDAARKSKLTVNFDQGVISWPNVRFSYNKANVYTKFKAHVEKSTSFKCTTEDCFCSVDCRQEHENELCKKCNKLWAKHTNHSCPLTGERGSWKINSSSVFLREVKVESDSEFEKIS